MSCRSRLAILNEKLTTLERRIEYLEARVRIYFIRTTVKIVYINIQKLVETTLYNNFSLVYFLLEN